MVGCRLIRLRKLGRRQVSSSFTVWWWIMYTTTCFTFWMSIPNCWNSNQPFHHMQLSSVRSLWYATLVEKRDWSTSSCSSQCSTSLSYPAHASCLLHLAPVSWAHLQERRRNPYNVWRYGDKKAKGWTVTIYILSKSTIFNKNNNNQSEEYETNDWFMSKNNSFMSLLYHSLIFSLWQLSYLRLLIQCQTPLCRGF